MLEALLRGPDEVLLLDEPDNYLDVPGKRWLEDALRESPKTVLFVSATTASCWPGRRPGSSPSSWARPATRPGRTAAASRRTTRPARTGSPGSRSCAGAGTRSTPKIKALVLMYKQKAAYNDGMAVALPGGGDPAAACSRRPARRRRSRATRTSRCGCAAARTGKRAVVCERLELTGLMKPFDLEVWYGERVAVLGSNGSGKSHFLRLLAAGGSDPDVEHRPVDDTAIAPVAHTGRARLGARVRPGLVRPDPRPPRAGRPDPAGHPVARRRPPRRDGPRAGVAGAGPLRAGARRGADLRVALRRPAGPAADPAARAVRGHPAAAGRADRQPRPGLGRGAGGGAGGLRRDGRRR